MLQIFSPNLVTCPNLIGANSVLRDTGIYLVLRQMTLATSEVSKLPFYRVLENLETQGR